MSERRIQLRLLAGGVEGMTLGGVEVWVAPSPPFELTARVLEEDGYLVMSAPTELRDPGVHPVRLHTDVLELEAQAPGSIVARAGRPVRLLAVVHDLAAEPTTGPEVVQAAFLESLRWCASRGLGAVGLVPLGAATGALTAPEAAQALGRAIAAAPVAELRAWWPAEAEDIAALRRAIQLGFESGRGSR